jgi:ferredoxin like protein
MKKENKPFLSDEVRNSIPHVNVDDMLVAVKFYVDETKAHLWIKDQATCQACADAPCLYFCPACVYRRDGEDGKTIVSFQSCIECGSCRIACPKDNIGWSLTRGGYGVAYKLG